MDEQLFNGVSPYSYLRRCFIHFPDSKHRLAIRAKMYGATICDVTSPNLTHIVVNDTNERDEISARHDMKDNVLFVSQEWLEETFVKKHIIPESEYVI